MSIQIGYVLPFFLSLPSSSCTSSPVLTCTLQIIRHAVSGMLPKNRLRDRRLARLKIFPTSQTGKIGANVMKSWEDGSLTLPCEPPVSKRSLKRAAEALKEGGTADTVKGGGLWRGWYIVLRVWN